MDDDQQYCLRWNNHQSTLISVFDTLLENETLVDCTLAAEGKILKAHKVVLSACSPYFATLLQEQYDKHPVFILKDVKYQELRAMMDYMYRGEVNISQDQLAALLKAAESLQIKGLSDNRTGSSAAPPTKPEPQHHRGKLGAGYTLEQTKRARMAMDAAQDVSGSREGSSSPSRRRRKVRRRSIENDAHDNSNSSMLQVAAASNQSILQQSNAASALVATQMPIIGGGMNTTTGTTIAANQGTIQQQPMTTTTNVTKKTESAKGTSTSLSTVAAAAASVQQQTTNDAMNTENVQIASSIGQGSGAVIVGVDEQVSGGDQKSNHKHQKLSKEASTSSAAAAAAAAAGELVIEPKSEYDDEGHEETVEDLTLDDEEMGMEELDQTAGTSQGGEGSSQGYAAWQHDRSQEELLLATQDAQQRDPQVLSTKLIAAAYNVFGMKNEKKVNGFVAGVKKGIKKPESSGEDVEERFPCLVCNKSYLRKRHLQRHMRDECIGIPPRFSCELCPSRFRRKYHMVRHLIAKHNIPLAIAQQTSGNGSRTSSQSTNTSITALAAAAGITVTGVITGSVPIPAHNVFGIKQEMHIGGGTNALAALSAVAAAAANGFNGGGGGGSSSCASGDNASVGSVGSHGCNSPIPENLSMRRDHYNNENFPTSPRNANGGSISPLTPHMMPISRYGLTGAITAISAAAAVVEEQAAAAAAAAAAGLMNNNKHGNEDEDGAVRDVSTMLECQLGGPNGNGNGINIKTEPGATTSKGQQNLMDEEWKMNLGLQIISNSLLKERLMNTMPYAYNKN